MEYSSERVAKPWLPPQRVSYVPDASTSLGSSAGLCSSAVTEQGMWGTGSIVIPSLTSHVLSQGDKEMRTPTKL